MRKTKTVEVADLRTLTHQELLNIPKDATNTVELRKQVVRLLQDRSHRPLGFAYASDREIEIALETLAPYQEKRVRWWRKFLMKSFELWDKAYFYGR